MPRPRPRQFSVDLSSSWAPDNPDDADGADWNIVDARAWRALSLSGVARVEADEVSPPPTLPWPALTSLSLTSVPPADWNEVLALMPALRTLKLCVCGLTALPESLPASLRALNLGYNDLEVADASLPPELEELGLAHCGLRSLPCLPRTLRWLCVDGNAQLASIGDLPPGLDFLSAADCTGLGSLPASALRMKTLLAQGTPLALLSEARPSDCLDVSRCDLERLPDVSGLRVALLSDNPGAAAGELLVGPALQILRAANVGLTRLRGCGAATTHLDLELNPGLDVSSLPSPLPRLQLLHLSLSAASGLLELAGYPSLRYLQLHGPVAGGRLALRPLAHLKEVVLRECALAELSLPRSLASLCVTGSVGVRCSPPVAELPRLEELTWEAWPWVGAALPRSLRTVHLSGPLARGELPAVPTHAALQELQLDSCGLVTTLPPLPPSLTALEMRRVQFQGPLLPLAALTRLHTLALEDCGLATAPASLPPSLRCLNLADNDSICLDNLPPLPKLTELLLMGCGVSEVLDLENEHGDKVMVWH